MTGPRDKNLRMVYLMNLITGQVLPGNWMLLQYPIAPLNPIKPEYDLGRGNFPDSPYTVANFDANGDGMISAFDSCLIIYQSTKAQAEIAELLEQLRGK